jgi:phospholipase C
MLRHHALSVTAAALLAGCGGSQPPISGPDTMPQSRLFERYAAQNARSHSPIQHIVVLVQERRAFNDLFATTKVGCMLVGHGKQAKPVKVHLKEVDLVGGVPLDDDYASYQIAYNKGTMCGFNLLGGPGHEGGAPYEYVNPAQIQPYRTAAAEYALADRMFQTQGGGDFTAHQDLIRGGTEITPTASIVDYPNRQPWGCPAPKGTKTSLITAARKYELDDGPSPCFSYKTLQTLLDAKAISWKFYTPTVTSPRDAFLAIQAVWGNRDEWSKHISIPETNVLSDIAKGALPSMSWVIPDPDNSDSPGPKDGGPAWVASVVDAIGKSDYWSSTAVVIVWDDWGGFYDPIPPPTLDKQGGPGFRVAMLVVSPYVPHGELSHTVYGFGSIVRFIEDTWKLGRLGTTDQTSTSIQDMFRFRQSPRPFVPISS